MRVLSCTLIAFLWVLLPTASNAEPFFAVAGGYKCSQCHSNTTGGGLRTILGNTYAQTTLPATRLNVEESPWTGLLGSRISIGANVRGGAYATTIPNNDTTAEFQLQQARLYIGADIVANRLSVYLDELVAPGAALNREAFVKYQSESQTWSLKAGQFYLPFGWRLQDNGAFVRQASGINMNTPDTGVELTWEPGPWSVQVAASNGNGGGAETDKGKQVSTQAFYITNRWRIGAGLNHNQAEGAKRNMAALMLGVQTGPITWLGEADYIRDTTITSTSARAQVAGLLEADWQITKGHALRVSTELLDANRNVSNDQQARYGVIYEYTPFQFIQVRGGARVYDGIPQSDVQNRKSYFVELHGFF